MANGINNRVFNMMEAIVDQTDVDFSVDFDTFDDVVVPLPEEDREYGRPLELPFWSEAGYPEKSKTTPIHMPSYAKLIEESDVKGSIYPKHWFRSWARSSDEEAILDRMYRGDDERGMVAYIAHGGELDPEKERERIKALKELEKVLEEQGRSKEGSEYDWYSTPQETGTYGKYVPSVTEFEPDTIYIYPGGIERSITGEQPTLFHEVLHEDKLLHRGDKGPYFFNPLSSLAYNYYSRQMYGNLVDKYGKEELIKMLEDLVAGKKLNIPKEIENGQAE